MSDSIQQQTATFERFSYGDEIVYTGPETAEMDGDFVAPRDRDQPYKFRCATMHGGLRAYTKFGGNQILSPDHPASNPEHWELA